MSDNESSGLATLSAGEDGIIRPSPGHVLLFVYGTLKQSYSNDVFSEATVFTDALASGAMYHAHSFPSYPVVNFDKPGVVWGEIVVLAANDPALPGIDRMEQGAGYVRREVVVECGGDRYSCATYHYPHSRHGDPIPDGYWDC